MSTETGKPLQVAVDLNRCQGYAQCCFLAPEVFELHGQEALWYDPAPEPVQRDRVRAAAAACPVQSHLHRVGPRGEPSERGRAKCLATIS
jgi:ferredoxin